MNFLTRLKYSVVGMCRVIPVLLLASFGLACSSTVPEELAPERILVNGKIITVDPDFSIAEAVAIRDGKFLAVGSSQQMRSLAGAKTEVVDLGGKSVVPGFNDGHGHVTLTWGRTVKPLESQLREATRIEDVIRILREAAEELPPGQLLFADRGVVSPSQFEENRWPNRWDLDRVAENRPILLAVGIAGTNVISNSRLMAQLGIDRRTPQPYSQGLQGEIVKDERGEPTGVFLGWAGQGLIRQSIQLYPTDVQAENIKRAALEMVRYGITTVGDPNTTVAGTQDNIPFIRAYEQLESRGELLVRVNCIPRIPLLTVPVQECIRYIDELPYAPGFHTDRLLLRQVKLVVNSSTSDFELPHDDVKAVVKAVHRSGWQLFIHVGGGEAFDVALQAIDEAYQEFPEGPTRHIITHARNPTEQNLEILARWGVVVDPQPGSLYNMADNAEADFQEPGRPAFGPLPLRTYLDRGIPLMISSDQQPVGPLFHIFEAVNRVRRSGKPILPEEAITVEEALRAATWTPAYSTFQEDLKGSIEPGKLADLVVLGRDLLTVPPDEIKDIPVLQTMVGGEFVYTNPDSSPEQKVEYWYPLSQLKTVLEVPAN